MVTPAEKKKGCPGSFAGLLLVAGVVFLLLSVCLAPIPGGIQHVPENAAMQQARMIGLLLFSYASDHDQHYPDGKSSTEVFQKLIDEHYCSDPAIFYIPRTGKSKPRPGERLKPENVCFDVTGGVSSASSDFLPVAFTTGYRINYVPDGDAVPVKGTPQFNDRFGFSTWFSWSDYGQKPWGGPGIAVRYKGNATVFLKASAAGIIPRLISPDYKPDGIAYRQLTPEGVLP